MIRILVVEDHELVRDAIAGLIAEAPGMAVVGVASTVEEAVAHGVVVAPRALAASRAPADVPAI